MPTRSIRRRDSPPAIVRRSVRRASPLRRVAARRLPSLVRDVPDAGPAIDAGAARGLADALALAQLARRRGGAAAHRSRSSAPIRCAAQRLAEEIAVVRAGAARRAAARLGNAALRPVLAAPGPRVRAPGDALPRRRAASATSLLVAATTALYRLAPPSYLAAYTFFLKQGETLDVDALRAQLALAGYSHVTQVVSPGRVLRARRADRPLSDGLRRCRTASTCSTTRSRSIRTFDVDTQRTLYPVRDVRLLPAREFPLDDAGRTRFRSRFREVFEGDPSKSRALQGHQQRHRARRHRVLPAAVLRRDGDARRLPAARARRRAARRRRGAVERFWQDTESRYRLLRGDKARPLLPPTELFLPPDAFNGAIKPFGARRDADADASAARPPDAPTRRCRRCRSIAAPTIRWRR